MKRRSLHAGMTGSLNQQWIKAAVIGSIWAAIEIIAGSFLHNLRVPFSGTILSMAAVFLLVIFIRHWPERGIIIRAGIIAALMKSISPSAIILGPMIGILMEAVILEVTWLLLGRNIIGYLIGGMIAVSWALFQKILTLLVLYGFDLVRIADAFYKFLVSKTGLDEISPVYLITLIVSLYAVAGMLAALAGYRAHKRMPPSPSAGMPDLAIQQSGSPFLRPPEKQKFASFNLLLVLLLLSVSLFLLNSGNYIPSLFSGGGLIIFVLLRYQHSIRHLKKISIWIQVLLITVLATLLWEWINTGEIFSVEGLIVGLEINFRAMMVIFSFSAISVELRNPLVRSLLYRNGLSNLYKAVSLAFTTLPAIIEQLPQVKNIFRQRASVTGKILYLAEELLNYMIREPDPHRNIYLVTGRVHTGKSTYISRLVDEMKEKNLVISGFIAKGTFNNNQRASFQLTDISTGDTLPLASTRKENSWFRYKKFYFNPEAFERGKKIITEALNNPADVIIVDEVGPMELSGKGWHEVLDMLEKNWSIPQVWVVRERILQEVRDRWHIPDENIYPVDTDESQNLIKRIVMGKFDQS